MLDSTRKKNTNSCKLALQARFRFQKKLKKNSFFRRHHNT